MIPSRESIYSALFTLASGVAGFVTKDRVLRHWTDVGPEEMPALFQVQKSETKVQQRGKPKVWELRGEFFVYVHTNSQQLGGVGAVPPSQILNPLLDDVENIFTIDDVSNQVCTLGGLVSHAWIDGTIETGEGTLGDHEVAIVPWAILVPSY